MNFRKPVIAYTAASNLEAHLIAEILISSGINALAADDQSGVPLFAFGTLTQFHRPDVWVDESDLERAAELIREFEAKQRNRNQRPEISEELEVICGSCGHASSWNASLRGTIQDCPHCNTFVDVGPVDWDEDFGVPED
ncbi:MAG: hypothetical protein RLZZ436_965 [Planctomycetota bacterium]|jgi:hypothetical protein